MKPFLVAVSSVLVVLLIVSTSVVSALTLPFFNSLSNSLFSSTTEKKERYVTTSLPSTYSKYIVTFKNDFDVSKHKHDHTQRLLKLFRQADMVFAQDAQGQPVVEDLDIGDFKGYIVTMQRDVADDIRAMDEVYRVEEDSVVHANDIQPNAPWGLSRISHRDIPIDHGSDYHYIHGGGRGVTVYIIDTGINIHHNDFEGRARWGKTIPENDEDEDGNGHGTHCAGIVGGKKYGVAKSVQLVAVKVLSSNGAGSMSDVIKGVEWAVKDHKARAEKDKKTVSVANMSLGGGYSKTLNRVVNAAVSSGVHFAVAAGNDDSNACSYSPASAKKAITVGASTETDDVARFSNHGECVDIFAPGKDIESTWTGSKSATKRISGTSMASPHVAGTVAYLLSTRPNAASVSPHDMKRELIQLSTLDHLHNLPNRSGSHPPPPFPFPFPPGDDDDEDEGETKNRLLYIGDTGDSEMTAVGIPLHVDGTTMKVVYHTRKISRYGN